MNALRRAMDSPFDNRQHAREQRVRLARPLRHYGPAWVEVVRVGHDHRVVDERVQTGDDAL